MTSQTVTDMRSFEGALGECYCHMFPGSVGMPAAARPVAWCGVPRAEQPIHGDPFPLGTGRSTCPACGNLRCPECVRLSREAARRR